MPHTIQVQQAWGSEACQMALVTRNWSLLMGLTRSGSGGGGRDGSANRGPVDGSGAWPGTEAQEAGGGGGGYGSGSGGDGGGEGEDCLTWLRTVLA